MKNKKIVQLDLAGIISGQSSGVISKAKLKQILKGWRNSKERSFFSWTNSTFLMGLGKAEEIHRPSNLLKPALAVENCPLWVPQQLKYRKYVEKDTLARRFSAVTVNEPTPEDTISILRGFKERYEVHHGVLITDVHW